MIKKACLLLLLTTTPVLAADAVSVPITKPGDVIGGVIKPVYRTTTTPCSHRCIRALLSNDKANPPCSTACIRVIIESARNLK